MDANTHKSPTALKWIVALVVLTALAALMLFLQGRMDREFRELPETERHALYLRTFETLQSTCARATGSTLNEYCREQAEFIMRFPECDRDCHEFAERFAPKPTR